MENYKEMYYELFRDVTNAIEVLKKAQQKAEESFLKAESSGFSVVSDENQ